MPFSKESAGEAEINRWFIRRSDRAGWPRPSEFALVLGGTVSAGAYTAGAVDFLIEALDCFAAAKAAGDGPGA